MKIKDLFESGKRLASQGIEVSRVTKQDFLTAKQALNPLLKKAGLPTYWAAGGAGSFDPEHPYGGGGREDSGDIDILIDPADLVKSFPADIEEFNSNSAKPLGAKAMANAMADEGKKAVLQMKASKWALANYLTKNGFETDPGTLTVQYSSGGRNFSVDIIPRPKNSWEYHTHDFSRDPGMRGGDLWVNVYPTLVKLASKTTFVDPKTGEEKGNLQYSPDRGIVDRDTNQVIATSKNDIAKILIGPEADARTIASVSGIRDALKKYPEKFAQLKGVLG
jgi:hypothetical protein